MSILGYLRDRAAAWLGPGKDSRRSGAETELKRSHIRTSTVPKGLALRLLPFFDRDSQQTPEARRQYRLMLKDPIVKSALLGKVFSVATLDLTVQPENEDRDKDCDVADWCRWATVNMEGGLRGFCEDILLPGLIDGYCLAEKVFGEVTDGKYSGNWTIKKARPIHPELYDLEVDEYSRVIGVIGRGPAAREHYTDLTPFILWRFLPLYDNPLGTSDLAAAYQAYWRRDTAWQMRQLHLRNLNGPYLHGTYPKDARDQKDVLEEAFKEAQGGGFLVTPEGTLVEVINIAVKESKDFQDAINDLNHEIMLSITGAFLQALEGTQTGARSIGEVHGKTSELGVWHLANIACGILNDQIYPDICALNYVGYSGLPKASLGGINDAELKDAMVIDTGLSALGLPLSRDWLYDKYNRTPPADDQDTLKPPAPPPAIVPPGVGFPGHQAFADVAGPAPTAAEQLLANAETVGSRVITAVTKAALQRRHRLVRIHGNLFSVGERKQLQATLASILGTANLLGRAKIREQLGAETFADANRFVHPMTPLRAYDYFQSLYPGGAGGMSAEAFGADVGRQAFTLAVTTEAEILARVQDAIGGAIAGEAGAAQAIADILEEAGVAPANPQYAEMVVRTNMMDAYNAGHDAERMDPDVIDSFPVWLWDGIPDGRQRETHAERTGRYYPADVTFDEVRGDDPAECCNCRCVGSAIFSSDWEKLQAEGAVVEAAW